MKRLIPTILILILGCNSQPETRTDILTGDLYFAVFRLGNYYNLPDTLINYYENVFDTMNIDKANKYDKQLLTDYKLLKERDLLYKPYIYIRTDLDSIVNLYLDTVDYNKIKIHKRQVLQDENKKVRIEASVKKISDRLYYCSKLRYIKLVQGETLLKQKKFLIEDYK